MQQRTLGRSGLTVSCIALGTMTWGGITDEHAAGDLFRAYVGAGGTLVDTAHSYADGASEEIIGSLLLEAGRDAVRICTKAGVGVVRGENRIDVSRGTLMDQLNMSLTRLGTDHVDVWLVHTWSDDVPLDETLGALEWAVTSGRARYVGVSNHNGWQLARSYSLLERARIPLVANEVEYSLVHRAAEDEVVGAAETLGIGLLAWSPLGRGVLGGRYRSGIPPESRAASQEYAGFARRRTGGAADRVVDALAIAARGLSVTPAEVALAWVRDRPTVASAIVGARTVAQLRGCLAAADLVLPDEITTALCDVSD